jgi:hypothetical protein
VRKLTTIAALLAVSALAACEKTGEGEFQVKTPEADVDVSTDTATIQTPSVDVGKDTVTVPEVDVETPAERKQERKDS